jgi:hypothetical protein
MARAVIAILKSKENETQLNHIPPRPLIIQDLCHLRVHSEIPLTLHQVRYNVTLNNNNGDDNNDN